MSEAVFSLIRYKFDKIFLDLENKQLDKLDISFDPSGIFNDKDNTFQLKFIFTASTTDPGLEKNNSIKVIEIRCLAFFRFKDKIRLEDIPDYFYPNSIAILFPYVRSFVSTVTLQANILPPVLLPTWNLTSLESVLKKNTIQK